MRKVQIYIEGQRIELFQDEEIQITSSIQNVQDIAKVFTDFSQSFTVPASEYNNQIFQHFYESSVDGTLNYQIRRNARIEIDLIPFRTGKIQLEKANMKKGMAESYTITFYGDIRTLQDLFGDDKLNSLSLDAYSHVYNGTEIKTRITSSSSYDVRYPLISSSRLWQYGGGGQQDISQNAHHIHYTELFPALRVSKIFQAIENKYSIDFQGIFLNDKRFTNLYLWLKNKNVYNNNSEKAFPFNSEVRTSGASVGIEIDTNLDNFNIHYNNYSAGVIDYGVEASGQPSTMHKFRVVVNKTTVPAISGDFWLLVYRNGTLLTTVSNTEDDSPSITDILDYTYSTPNTPSLNETFNFVVRSSINETFNCFIQYELKTSDDVTILETASINAPTDSITFTNNVNLSGNMPDMKVNDFVAGILKVFNLTCYGITPTTFQVEPLENWYAKGRIVDVTEYTDINSVDIQRVPLYKNITFKYQDSETFLNQEFYNTFNRHYGSLEQTYQFDGGDYKIELPFETFHHQKFTGTNIQVAYSLNTNYEPVIPKPVLLYMNDHVSTNVSFYYNDGSTTTNITQYMPFGQDVIYNSTPYSMNFGYDISTYFLEVINNNLFSVYYYNYLSNLYQRKNRLFYYKAILPTSISTSLKLNDRLKIRDKRYIINEIKTNLNTGEVDLVLLLDFRPVQNNSTPLVKKNILTIRNEILFPDRAVSVNINTGATGIIATPNSLTSEGEVIFTLPSLTPSYTIIAENSDDIITEQFEYIRSEENNNITYQIALEYLFEDGSNEAQPFYIIQEA